MSYQLPVNEQGEVGITRDEAGRITGFMVPNDVLERNTRCNFDVDATMSTWRDERAGLVEQQVNPDRKRKLDELLDSMKLIDESRSCSFEFWFLSVEDPNAVPPLLVPGPNKVVSTELLRAKVILEQHNVDELIEKLQIRGSDALNNFMRILQIWGSNDRSRPLQFEERVVVPRYLAEFLRPRVAVLKSIQAAIDLIEAELLQRPVPVPVNRTEEGA